MYTASPLIRLLTILFILVLSQGCEKEESGIVIIENPDPVRLAVNPANTHQTIAGFGGASRMWGTRFLTDDEAEKVFGTTGEGLGLSIFRIRIAPNPSEWANIVPAARAAQRHGAKVIACPWSPPAAMKTNNSEIGGQLAEDQYPAFRDHLNQFVTYMNGEGVNIHAISIQNEPDIQVSYESCDYSVGDMRDFITKHGNEIVGTKVMAPESFNFNPSFTNTLLQDQEAAPHFDIVAGHIYGGGLGPFPLAEAQGKEIWMTEYLLNLQTGRTGMPAWVTYDQERIWDESLEMLESVHEAMRFNWNAYVWWYIRRYYSFIGEGEQGTTDGEILKRGHAFAHFASYVRPGQQRIDATMLRATEVKATAYDAGTQIIVVIINPTEVRERGLQIELGDAPAAAAAVETNLNNNRRAVNVTIKNTQVVLNVSAKSVTTVVIDK